MSGSGHFETRIRRRETRADRLPISGQLTSAQKQLSGQVAEMAGAFVCASLGIFHPCVTPTTSWLEQWRARHFSRNQQPFIMLGSASYLRRSIA